MFLVTRFLGLAFVVATARALFHPPAICQQISESISSASDVHYPGSADYSRDNAHWAASSSQASLCSVEPSTAQDVATILTILGSTRTPFAVKGGGHASNPGFSSTKGVQIAMSRFSQVTYDNASKTVEVGSGLVWDDVYEALEEYGVNVVGGRVTGVGVAGFTLGGGYSWLSNQYGLTIDSVVAYELVKPNGDIVNVTGQSDPDLFFALKGGLNNYGIVTRFIMKTYPQGQVWGGLVTFTWDQIDKVTEATVKFSSDVTDPKAGIISTYNFVLGQPGVSLLVFYDAPTPPDGIFEDFLAIPYFSKDLKTRSFISLVQAAPSDATYGTRGVFQTVPLMANSAAVLDAVRNESVYWGAKIGLLTGAFLSYDVEPFQPNLLAFNSEETAYPSDRSVSYLPLNLYYSWSLEATDDVFHDAIRESAAHLREVAFADGQQAISTASLYPNYAIYDTPIEALYGDNLPRLQEIKAAVDPDNVMDLAGGFKI